MILAKICQQINTFDIKTGGEEADVTHCAVRDESLMHLSSKF